MEFHISNECVGVALLVSNGYEGANKIKFTHEDTTNMEEQFKEFGYDVFKRTDVDFKTFQLYYRALADRDYPPTCKRILIYFSGHGADGVLDMQDGGCANIEDIITCFKTGISQSNSIPGMVKMFFFDACRGPRRDYGLPKSRGLNINIPNEGGILVAYGSTPHHVCLGDSYGSRWTIHLVTALKESTISDDVCHILTNANKLMRMEAERDYRENEQRIEFQTAEHISSLAEFVCFKKEAPPKN